MTELAVSAPADLDPARITPELVLAHAYDEYLGKLGALPKNPNSRH
jgi:hypothetical protein